MTFSPNSMFFFPSVFLLWFQILTWMSEFCQVCGGKLNTKQSAVLVQSWVAIRYILVDYPAAFWESKNHWRKCNDKSSALIFIIRDDDRICQWQVFEKAFFLCMIRDEKRDLKTPNFITPNYLSSFLVFMDIQSVRLFKCNVLPLLFG